MKKSGTYFRNRDEGVAFVLWQKCNPSIPARMGKRVAWMMDAAVEVWWATFPPTGPGHVPVPEFRHFFSVTV
jgi:hypothetical protein